MLAVAVAVALATGGLAYGASGTDDGTSTRGAHVGKAAPAGAAPVGGTADMRPNPGVQPPTTIPPGSTADAPTEADQAPAITRTTSRDVDKSDRGKKGLKPTKDRGRRKAPVTKG